jgi:hypothetical protein
MVKDPCGSALCWNWGSWGLSRENSSEKIVKKSFAIVKGILEDPHCIGLVALGDHQIKTALINVEKVSKL